MINRELLTHEDFRPPSEEYVEAVNNFFEIESDQVLNFNLLPKRIPLQKLWQEALPLIDQNPQDRELYIGWDLIDRKLQITEVTEGLKYEEIVQDPIQKSLSFQTGGELQPLNTHLIDFHTHPFVPDLERSTRKKHLQIYRMPRSTVSDLFGFSKDSRHLARVIVDISQRKNEKVGSSFVAMKTTASWNTNQPGWQTYLWELLNSEYLGLPIHIHETVDEVFCGHLVIERRLQPDEQWSRTAGLAIYRGLVWEDTDKPQYAIRYDEFYRRLLAMKKSRFFGLL